MKIKVLLAIFTLSFFLAKAVPPHINYSAKSLIYFSEPPSTLNKTLLLQLVNKVRQSGCQCGSTYYYPAPPLTWNDKLEAAALGHSKDMYTNHYFSHVAKDGSKGGARIDAVGYRWMAYGENIGMGYSKEKEVVDAWLKSPEHCKNIMNKMYKEMGAARVGNYWTQDFGAR